MLVDKIKQTGYQIRGHLSKDELERIAKEKNIALTYEYNIKKEGWMGKPKGLLQILWERGFVDEKNVSLYSLKGKKYQLDEDGNLKKQFERYSLRTLMKRCSDFANEKSAMEHLFIQLSRKAEPTLSMLISPKYHCEVAGEGIEFDWGMLKRRFRSFSLEEKNTKQKFNKCVRDGVENYMTIKNVINFAGLSRRYMMAYRKHANSDDKTLTFDGIEKYTKRMKTHRNVSDIEKGLIKREYAQIGLCSTDCC